MEIAKHPPPKLANAATTTIYLSTKTPFVSAMKRLKRNMATTQRKRLGRYVVVYGLGKAIQRALAIAMELQTQGYRVKVYTRTLYALDEHINEDEGIAQMVRRPVGAIELHVYPQAEKKRAS